VLLEDKIDGQVNIEAGIVVENKQQVEKVFIQPLSISEANFMQSKELEEHALEVSELLPLDVNVVFDWRTLTYHVEISLCDVDVEWPEFDLQLPDLSQSISNNNLGKDSVWIFEHPLTDEPKELLVDHAYKLNFSDGSQHRGFIVERNSLMRRVEQFDSLDDIFSSLIDGRSLENNANSALRNEILGDDQDWLYEQDAGSISEKEQSPTLSYFRMFQAMDNLEQRITKLKSDALIEQYAFVIPGCLVEIGEKIRSELQENANVFNWYMKQEFNLLVDVAKKQSKDSELKSRLSGLRFKSSDSVIRTQGLQNKIGSSEYRKLIKEKCKYVSI
jgi:ribosome-associated translation inhibitor RaiA